MAYDPTKCAYCNRDVPPAVKALQDSKDSTKNFCGMTCMTEYLRVQAARASAK